MSGSVWFLTARKKKIEFKQYPVKKSRKKTAKKSKKKTLVGLFFGLILILFSTLISAAVIEDDLHLNIQVTHSNGTIIPSSSFDFAFNISNNSNCAIANVIYSNLTTITTDTRGIISYYLLDVNLSYDMQYWLCYYRDGVLINNSKIARVPYTFTAKNISAEGVKNDSNLDLTNYNATAHWFKGIFNWTISTASNLWLSFTGSELSFNETRLNDSIDSRGGILTVNRSDWWDNYDVPDDIVYSDLMNAFWDANVDIGAYNLSVDTDTLFVDSNLGRVGIGTGSPQNTLNVIGDGNFTGDLIVGGTIENGLIGYWPMDDNAANTAVKDYSGNGNDGTFGDTGGDANTNTHTTTGKIGRALEFDGNDDYVIVGNFNTKNDRTFSLWVNPSDILANKAVMGETDGIIFQLDTNKLEFWSDVTAGPGASQTFTININEWIHIVAVATNNGANIAFYKDGVDISSTNPATTFDGISELLHIGMWKGANRHFNGLIDETRIYDRALSAREIAELYRQGSVMHGGTVTDGDLIIKSNVGIGTTGPNATLEVINSTTQGGFMVSSDSQGAGDLFIVDEGGRVGIGTATPQNLLNVDGDANVTGTLYYGTLDGEADLNVNDSDYLDGYNSSFFMPLNKSMIGDFDITGSLDIDGTWQKGGVTIDGGDVFAQALYVYSIYGLNVSDLDINGSLLPAIGFDNTFDIGNATLRWRDLYLGGHVYSNGTGDNYFLGDVGIGTGSPSHSLNVVQDVDALGGINISNPNAGASAAATLYLTSDDGISRIYDAGTTLTIRSETADRDIKFMANDGGATITPLFIDVSAGGNVGIGTSSPGHTLTVKSGATGGADVNLSNTLFVNGSNVGIGTSSPDDILHIADSSDAVLSLHRTTTTVGHYSGIQFKVSSDTNDDYYNAGILFERTNEEFNTGGKLHFAMDAADVGNVAVADAKMTILQGGNVGIGTSGPNATLEVINSTTQGGFMVSSDSQGAGDLFIVDEGGNVGIGTSSPITILHAKGTDPQLLLETTGGNDAAFIQKTLWNSFIYGGAYYNGTDDVYGISGRNALNIEFRHNADDTTWFSFNRAPAGTDGNAISWTELMRIQQDGKVGIGETAPVDVVHITADEGNIFIQHNETTNVLSAPAGETVTTTGIKFGTSIGSDSWYSEIAGTVGEYSDAAGLRFSIYNGSLTETMTIGGYVGGTFKPYVGIGTSNPSHTLNVDGTMNVTGILYSTSDIADAIKTRFIAGRAVTGVGDGDLYLQYGKSDPVYIGLTGTSDLYVSGKVGIGTASPLQLLHVENISGDAYIRVGGYHTSDMGFEFGATTGSDWVAKNAIVTDMASSWYRGDMHFILNNAASTADYTIGTDTKMIIEYDTGNVGIGTTGPTAPLHVFANTDVGSTGPTTGSFLVGDVTDGTYIAMDDNEIQAFVSNAASSGDLHINNDGGTVSIHEAVNGIFRVNTDDIYVESGGQVAIGATIADATLDIATGGLNVGNVGTNAAAGDIAVADEVRIGINDATYLFLSQNTINTAAAGTDLNLQSAGGTTDYDINMDVETLFVDGSANSVGIGTESPTLGKLHVNGTIATPSATATESHGFRSNTATWTYNGKLLNAYGFGNHDPTPGGALGSYVSGYYGVDFFTNSALRMTIEQGGDVGIGTDNPVYKLDVAGDIHLTGLLKGTSYKKFVQPGTGYFNGVVTSASGYHPTNEFEDATSDTWRISVQVPTGATRISSIKVYYEGTSAGNLYIRFSTSRWDTDTAGTFVSVDTGAYTAYAGQASGIGIITVPSTAYDGLASYDEGDIFGLDIPRAGDDPLDTYNQDWWVAGVEFVFS